VDLEDVGSEVEWMRTHHCVLAAGDGIGLNYIAEGEQFARAIEAACG
jgi:hypothetical protein